MRFVVRLSILLAAIFVVSLFNASTLKAQWSSDLDVTHGAHQEYYYWDDDKIVGVAGFYREKETWSLNSGNSTFLADDDNIPLVRPDRAKDDTCNTMPSWQNEDHHLELRERPDHSLILDLTGDGSSAALSTEESGLLKWGGYDFGFNDRECEWHIYNGFNKTIPPYEQTYLKKGIPYAGKILGQRGMSFEDWVARSDRLNSYNEYKISADDNIMERCNDRPDKDACINDLTASFEKCYASNVGSTAAKVDTNNIESSDWARDLDANKFVECMKSDTSTDKYFDGDKEDFIRKILEDANIPASIKPPLTPKAEDGAAVDEKTVCAIERIGWIVCPVMSFISMLTDSLFGILKNWLVVQPFLASSGTNKATTAYQAWQAMRDIANVIFVLCFLVIIYTHLTNAGISKYSMSKLLPRLIITALLVNTSYFICSVGVDISNVLGDSLFKIVRNIPDSIESGQAQYKNWEWITTSVVLAGGAAAGTIATIASLSALVPIMLLAFLSLVVTLLVLLLRQVLIILLVVVSPIAFAMYLLPNTRKWFDRWKSMFINMLLLYPAIALVFSGSYLASQIVMRTAQENGEILLAIFALGIQVIPLFIAPIVMKLGGGVLNRFGGIVNNPNKGPFDRLKKRSEAFRDDRKNLQKTRAANGAKGTFGINGGIQRRGVRREAKINYRKEDMKRSRAKMFGSTRTSMFGNEKSIADSLAKASGGKGNDELREMIKSKLKKQLKDQKESDMQAESVLIDHQIIQGGGDYVGKLKQDALSQDSGVSEAQRKASVKKIVENGNDGDINELISNLHKLSSEQRNEFAKAIEQSNVGSSAAHLAGSGVGDTIREGVSEGGTEQEQSKKSQEILKGFYKKAIEQGAYTPSVAGNQSAESIKGMAVLSEEEKAKFKQQFATAAGNAKINQHITSSAKGEVSKL